METFIPRILPRSELSNTSDKMAIVLLKNMDAAMPPAPRAAMRTHPFGAKAQTRWAARNMIIPI